MNKVFIVTVALIFLSVRASTVSAKEINFESNGKELFTFECNDVNGDTYMVDSETPYDIPRMCVGVYEVTQELWQKIMKANPAHFRSSPKNPVENISYNDAIGFIAKINKAAETSGFRLMTYTEWLYLTQASVQEITDNSSDNAICEKYNLYDESSRKINGFGNKNYKCNDSYPYTAPVDASKADANGFYNLIGNVAEWGLDSADKGIAKHQDSVYYSALKSPKTRVILGGSFSDGPNEMKRLFNSREATTKFGGSGFRLVYEYSEEENSTDQEAFNTLGDIKVENETVKDNATEVIIDGNVLDLDVEATANDGEI